MGNEMIVWEMWMRTSTERLRGTVFSAVLMSSYAHFISSIESRTLNHGWYPICDMDPPRRLTDQMKRTRRTGESFRLAAEIMSSRRGRVNETPDPPASRTTVEKELTDGGRPYGPSTSTVTGFPGYE